MDIWHTSFSEKIQGSASNLDDNWAKDVWYSGYIDELEGLLRKDGYSVTQVKRLEDEPDKSITLEISW